MCYGHDNEINYYARLDDVSYFVPGFTKHIYKSGLYPEPN